MSREDDYDDYDDAPAQKVWGAASILVGVAALAGFLALAWYAYHSGSTTTDPASAELVQADATPYKEVPKDPGGWQAPHRDKTIYEVIDNARPANPTAERLTPSPEEPMEVATSESGTGTWMNAKLRGDGAEVPLTDAERQKGGAETPSVESKVSDDAKNAVNSFPLEGGRGEGGGAASSAIADANPSESEPSRSTPTPPSPLKGEGDDRPVAVAKAPAPVAKTPAKPTIKGGTARVQLGAFRSEGEAAAHVKHLGSRVPGILSGHSTTVERADLGEKGIYYRLFALNFSREEAGAACARIKAARLDCMVK